MAGDTSDMPDRRPAKLRAVALTGSSGALGGHVLDELVRRGVEVRALVRASPPMDRGSGPVTWIRGSLEDPEALDRLVEGVDAILHLAYSPVDAVPEGGRSPGEQFAEANFVGTVRLIERIPRTRLRQLLFTSTLAVHGRAPFRHDCDEDVAVWPGEFYGAHKAALEKLVFAASETWNLNTSIWRLGWILADYADPARDPLARPLREAREHGEIRDQHASYLIAADDAAKILCDALGDETTKGRRFQVFDRWVDWNELVGPLSDLLGRPIRAAARTAPEPSPGISRAALNSRQPEFSTDSAIRRHLQRLIDHGL